LADFSCEVKLDDGPFELVYGGEKPIFEYIARKPGLYAFRARACNNLGEGNPSEEACLLIKDGDAFDPYTANGPARVSTKTSISRISNLRRRRAKRRKLRVGEETPVVEQKQPKDRFVFLLCFLTEIVKSNDMNASSPQVRQLHKLIYSPHCTVQQLEAILKKNGFDLLRKFTSASGRGKGGENALIASIRAERADLADFFLRRQNVAHYDPNMPDTSFGRTPLVWAIMMHQSETAFGILQLKKIVIDVNKADIDGTSPLYWAVALRCSYALVNALVKRGADPNQPLIDDAGRPTFLLHEFIFLNDADAARQLITQFNALPDPLDSFEELYDLEVAACIDEIEMVGHPVDPVSLKSSANLEKSTGDIEPPATGEEEIDSASDSDDDDLEEDEEDDLPDPPIVTALQQCNPCGFEVFTLLADRWLASAGTDVTLRNRRLSIMAHFSVVLNNLQALRWLVYTRNFQVDSVDANNRTVLHTALALDANDSILAFLMQDCNCNDQIIDHLGYNALELSNLVTQKRDQEAAAAAAKTASETSSSSSEVTWDALEESISESVRAALLKEETASAASQYSDESSMLIALPTEILTIVLCSLHAKDLCKFQRTCKVGLAVGRSDLVWRNLTLQVFGGEIRGHIKQYSVSWMHSFRQRISASCFLGCLPLNLISLISYLQREFRIATCANRYQI
jgi:ankyrin repeat protein